MERVCTSELQQKITTLRRAPPPKPPVPSKDDKPQEGELFRVKLKSTVKPPDTNKDKDAENTESEDNVANNNKETKTRASSIKKLSQAFENGSPGKPVVPGKPAVASKKPVVNVRPTVPSKPPVSPSKSPVNPSSNQNKRARPPSVLNRPDPRIVDSNKDTRIPEIKPLPPVFALGDPPQKPSKFGLLKPSLKKYLGTSYPPRPVASENISEAKPGNNEVDTSPPAVQDAPAIPKKPTRPEPEDIDSVKKDDAINSTSESVTEDFYDDTGCSNVADTSDEIYDDTMTSNVPEPSEEFYDDTACTNGLTTPGAQDETFGEDIYEPISANQEEQSGPPAEKALPTLPAKDDKKKKEKERKKKEREEKEEKEREEKERKKKEKEREKKINEMKRRFSVKGSERSLGTCRAAEDIPGNKMDIAASIGEEFDIVRKGKPIPDNKWLVKNKQGLYGFIDINKIEREPAEDPEDLYEEVPASKQWSSQSSNGDHISSPPVTSPPPPPTQNAPRPPAGEQEIYDDVAGEDAEELYELLPEN